MSNEIVPEPIKRSHYVTLYYFGCLEREEIFLNFATKWRGVDAIVTMSCDRYMYANDELSEWRIYATEARGKNDTEYGYHLTDTARRRLSDQHKEVARQWLDSDAYRESERNAYMRAVRRVGETHHYGLADKLRRTARAVRDKIGPDAMVRFEQAADAYDAFTELLEN